uniref:Uncharacterized protein n=1 Tax=Strigamia maritima TaxID=126957 RepID=T1IN67_STRMM
RNNNFHVSISLPPEIFPAWPKTGFKQLSSDHKSYLQLLTSCNVICYMKHRIAADNEEVNNIKALEKGKLMYDGRKIEACSICVVDNDLYFTGIVGAAMKKKEGNFLEIEKKLESKLIQVHGSSKGCGELQHQGLERSVN